MQSLLGTPRQVLGAIGLNRVLSGRVGKLSPEAKQETTTVASSLVTKRQPTIGTSSNESNSSESSARDRKVKEVHFMNPAKSDEVRRGRMIFNGTDPENAKTDGSDVEMQDDAVDLLVCKDDEMTDDGLIQPDTPVQSVEGRDFSESSYEEPTTYLYESSDDEGDASDLEYFAGVNEASSSAYMKDFNTEWPIDESHVNQYEFDKAGITGAEDWNPEAAALHQVLGLRGLFPVMPHSWSGDLVDHPELEELFPRAEDSRPVLFGAVKKQFFATKALRRLFELHSRLQAYRQEGRADKIGRLIIKELRSYKRWCEWDIELDRGFDFANPVFVTTLDEIFAEEPTHDPKDFEGHVRRHFRHRARNYRRKYRRIRLKQYPRMMYGYIVVQHLVMIMVLDTSVQGAKPELFARLDMSALDSWLDSGLAVAIPMHFAKRAMATIKENLPKKEGYVDGQDDTDDL